MSDVAREGQNKIDRWQNSTGLLDRAKSHIIATECELANATNDLGEWLLPDDAKVGETFCVWHGAIMIAVTKTEDDFKIKIRTSKRRAQMEKT